MPYRGVEGPIPDNVPVPCAQCAKKDRTIWRLRSALARYAEASVFTLSVDGYGTPEDQVYVMLHIGPDVAYDALDEMDEVSKKDP